MLINLIWLFVAISWVNGIHAPGQAVNGPGGSNYVHEEVLMHDFAQEEDGYWLFEPANPQPDSAHLVVFIHGYGAINPMIYGGWIKHLVRKGNLVVFPRYQKSLFKPSTEHFVPNVARAIRDAIHQIDTSRGVKVKDSSIALVGHSYGGTIAANLAVHYDSLMIPKPNATFLCSPGTGPFKGGLLDSYEGMPADLKLLIMVSKDDKTVGDKLGVKIFETATQTKQRNLIRQRADRYGTPAMTAGHNECYSLDEAFDCGIDNLSTKRARHKGKVDMVDYFGYWKLLDALLECSRTGDKCDYAYGNSKAQRFMGNWSDGQPVKELEIILPEMLD